MEEFDLRIKDSFIIKLALYFPLLDKNSDLNFFPFSGATAVNQYLSVIPNHPVFAFTEY